MLRAQFHSNQRITLVRTPIPTPGPGEVLVRVAACCVCGSDLRTFVHGNARVQNGATLGHELAGTIAEIGAGVSNWKVGDRVAVGADVPCGHCEWCSMGLANSCAENLAIGYQFDGGFAEYILLDKRVVLHGPMVHVPKHVSLDTACLAEPLACCLNGFDHMLPLVSGFSRAKISVVVFGAGPIGCLLALLAKDMGFGSIVVLDTSRTRVQWLERFTGIHSVWLDKSDAWLKAVSERTSHPKLIFTACSTIEAIQSALCLAGPYSVVNCFGGLPKSADALEIAPNLLHYHQATLTGTHGSTPSQFIRAMELLSSGRVAADALITERFALSEIQSAFQVGLHRNGLKTLIRAET